MKAPISWLKEYVDIDVDIETLCKKMVDIGLEIEEVDYLGKNVQNVVIGQIKAIEKHPNADKLVVCGVDIGAKDIQIVTNSKTVKVGDKVGVALDGATLATGQHIEKGELRGVFSDGMFCGPEELGITKDLYEGADVDGVLVLSKNAIVGGDVRKEVGTDDYVIDVCVTSNRPDCDSVYGLAREVAVALGKKCKPLPVDYQTSGGNVEDYVKVSVEAQDLCPAYFACAVKDVKVGQSPLWLTSRLAKVGLHGISNIVDITNYVLMEVGQPMHGFDENDLSDKTIVVRRAFQDEKIVPLDGKEYTLTPNNLVIADKTRAVGLAGIMGGQNSGIKDSTTAVVFEAAKFAHDSIRHTSRDLGLRSDSSARFEKGVDVYSVQLGLARALHLVCQLGCGKVVDGRIAKVSEKPFNTSINFDYSEVKRILGISVSKAKAKKILNSMDIEVNYVGKQICCVVPPYRTDLSAACDIVEEIIRVYGYDNIKGTLLENCHITMGGKHEDDKFLDKIEDILVGLRYSECVFYPFGGKALYDKLSLSEADVSKNIRLKNPLGEELSLMRTTMCADMLSCAALNNSRKNTNIRLFEYGAIYLADKLPLENLPYEQKGICAFASGVDFDTFKAEILTVVSAFGVKIHLTRSDVEFLHPGISANVYANGEKVGFIGKVHPKIASNFGLTQDGYIASLNFDLLYSLKNTATRFVPFAKYPPVDRDFALVMDEDVLAQDVLDEIKANCPLCEYAKLFDIYRSESLGVGKKSIAVNVRFRAADKTLKDVDIEGQISVCLKALKDKFGAELRS